MKSLFVGLAAALTAEDRYLDSAGKPVSLVENEKVARVALKPIEVQVPVRLAKLRSYLENQEDKAPEVKVAMNRQKNF